MLVHDLSWGDVDPSTHPFDSNEVLKFLKQHLAGIPSGSGTEWQEREIKKISELLQKQCGSWSAGWDYSATEPGGGGPVHGWCCSTHSFFAKGYDAEAVPDQAKVMAEALGEWRSFLEQVSQLFHQVAVPRDAAEGPRQLALAASRFLSDVVERTESNDAWYGLMTHVCVWFLEFRGLPRAEAEACAQFLSAGKFESWLGPDETQSRHAAESFSSKAYDALVRYGLTDA